MCVMHYYRVRKHGDPDFVYYSKDQTIQRFWTHVDKTPGHGPWGDCWIFTGNLNDDGYGCHSAGGPKWERFAHRFSYWIVNGDIPPECLILHNCDNRPCVNPDHLRPGTQIENMQDRYSRGRCIKGSGNSMAKLTDAVVKDIRRRTKQGETRKSIANRLGVTLPTISRICLGKGWTHVQGE